MSLSSVDAVTGSKADFEVTLNHDGSVRDKIGAFLGRRGISHFIIVDNVVFDKKRVDFGSENVTNTLYMTQSNGKVYKWGGVGVSFIHVGEKSLVTCILSNSDAKPYNRREAFRIPVDQYGAILWSGEENQEKCMVLNISHTGIGIFMEETSVNLGIGYPAEITWAESFFSAEKNQQISHVYKVQADLVRVQPKLGGGYIIGFRLREEPDAIRDMIQKVQTSRGIVKEAEVSNQSKGLEKNEDWEIARDLEKLN